MQGTESSADDPFDLNRFVFAQEINFSEAMAELMEGKKKSHWIWYVFPQIAGLGTSEMNRRYAIASLREAEAYLAHPLLGARLRDSTRAVLAHRGVAAEEIFGWLDALKFRSCMTLFECAAPDEPLFGHALHAFFAGDRDLQTLRALGS